MKNNAVISASNLSIGYPKSRKQKETVLYEDLSFDLYRGELTCLLGVNGAGKSTLLRTLTGLQRPLQNEVFLNQKSINKYKEQDLSTLLGLVLTDKTSVGGLTVSELVGLGRYPYTGFFGKLSVIDYEIIAKAMNDVCISHKANTYVSELSDGERQKVMIAKALAQECPIIILDEPTAFLDVVNRFEVMNLLHHLAVTQNKAILLSTHDVELALLLADRLWLLSKERGLKTGVTEDIVLSNAINEYVTDGNIFFDNKTGRFLSVDKLTKQIYLGATDELFYWGKNFLARNGYQVSTDEREDIRVIVESLNNISVEMKGRREDLNSFEDLGKWLRLQG